MGVFGNCDLNWRAKRKYKKRRPAVTIFILPCRATMSNFLSQLSKLQGAKMIAGAWMFLPYDAPETMSNVVHKEVKNEPVPGLRHGLNCPYQQFFSLQPHTMSTKSNIKCAGSTTGLNSSWQISQHSTIGVPLSGVASSACQDTGNQFTEETYILLQLKHYRICIIYCRQGQGAGSVSAALERRD